MPFKHALKNAIHPETSIDNLETQTLLKKVRRNGLGPSVRAQIWPILLHPTASIELHLLLADAESERADSFYLSKGGTEPWAHTVTRISTDAQRISDQSELLRGPRRDAGIQRLKRVLTAYAMYDCEVGYCQGMTDLAAPFLELYDKDEEALAIFGSLMSRLRPNFLSGMHSMQHQLKLLGEVVNHVDGRLHRHLVSIGAGSYIFAFQMLLLQLSREVSWSNLFTLWECMWAAEALLNAAQPVGEHSQRRPQAGALLQQPGTSPELVMGTAPGYGTAARNDGRSQIRPPQGGPVVPCKPGPGIQDGSGEGQDRWEGIGQYGGPGEGADLRVFLVAAALCSQRKRLLACQGLEEVVQFANRFPQPQRSAVIALVHEAERIYVTFQAAMSINATTKDLRSRRLWFSRACLGG